MCDKDLTVYGKGLERMLCDSVHRYRGVDPIDKTAERAGLLIPLPRCSSAI